MPPKAVKRNAKAATQEAYQPSHITEILLQIPLNEYIAPSSDENLRKIVDTIVSIVPNVDRSWVLRNIKPFKNMPNLLDYFMQTYIENKDYPVASVGKTSLAIKEMSSFMENRAGLSAKYKDLSRRYVLNAFPYFPIELIDSALQQNNNQLVPTMEYIRKELTITAEGAKIGNKTYTIQKSSRLPFQLAFKSDSNFEEEVVAYEYHRKQEQIMKEVKFHNALYTKMANLAGLDLYTCPFCTRKLFAEDLVVAQCANLQHGLCKECFATKASETIRMVNPRLECVHQDCHAPYHLARVKELIGEGEFKVYLHSLRRIALKKVEPPGWMQCIRCGEYAPMPPGKQKVFICPRKECGAMLCLECKQDAHWGIPCPVVEEAKLQELKEYVDNRMMAVHTQKCPNCPTRVAKLQNCNHVSCPDCKTHFCYNCGIRLPAPGTSGIYDHFHTSNCPMYPPESNQLAARETRARAVGAQAAAEWRRAHPEYAHLKLPAEYGF